MKSLLILGGGTAGTMMANKLAKKLDADHWRITVVDKENILYFYTLEGAASLSKFMEKFEGGRVVLNVAEMPIKCPVAPLEFVFLADWYFTRRGLRDKVDITYATPLPG